MKNLCDEIVAALTTGGPIHRWRARRHAARCPRCAAMQDALAQVAEALAEAPALTAAERALWSAAAEREQSEKPAWVIPLRPALAGALAAGILGVVCVWWAVHTPQKAPSQPNVAVVERPPTQETTDVKSLRGEAVALAQELDQLSRRADLLDARKDVDALMARFAARAGASEL
jgi:hypothetical protein